MIKSSSALVVSILIVLGLISCKTIEKANSEHPNKTKTTITLSLTNSFRSLSEGFMCFNVNSLLVKDWSNQNFLKAVNQLNPRILRLPGGTVANYWDWRRGGIIQDLSNLPEGLPQFIRRHHRYTASKLEDFQVGLESTNTNSILVVNMLTSNLEEQISMLLAAKSLGIAVKHIELGNEFYFGIDNYRKVFKTPQDYAQTASQWIVAIKKEFPHAKISVLGTIPKPDRPARLQNWNQTLLKRALPQADAITLHYYKPNGLDHQEVFEGQDYPFFTAEDVPIILGEPFKNWQDFRHHKNFQLIPEDKRIWITEYNLHEPIGKKIQQGETPRIMGTWVQGMSVMLMSLLFLEEERVDIICKHSLLGNFGATAIFPSDTVRILKGETATTPMSLSASGLLLRLLGDATEGMTTAQKLDFSEVMILRGKGGFTYPALYGWMFSNGKAQRALIMNLSAENIDLDLGSIFSQGGSYEQLSSNPQTLVTQPRIVTESRGAVSGQINLPAYSVTKLSH
jgi:hypothetical protein